jgi:hypothetical protein
MDELGHGRTSEAVMCRNAVNQRPTWTDFAVSSEVYGGMAGAGGIEPPNGGIKIRRTEVCSTAFEIFGANRRGAGRSGSLNIFVKRFERLPLDLEFCAQLLVDLILIPRAPYFAAPLSTRSSPPRQHE